MWKSFSELTKAFQGRALEEEEALEGDEDHRWSKRTQSVLNSIVTKSRLTGESQQASHYRFYASLYGTFS